MEKKLAALIILELIIAGIAVNMTLGASVNAQAEETPILFVMPEEYEAEKVNEIFNVTVNIDNILTSHKMVGAGFRLTYNGSLLEVMDVVEGEFMQQFNNPVAPPYTYFISYVETDGSYGPHVLVGIQLLPNATGEWINFPEGNGTLTTITFKAIYRTLESVECTLNLTDTIIVDENINEVEHTTASATYKAKAILLPTLNVQPDTYHAMFLGETFDISVNIDDLDSDLRLVGLDFRFLYNDTLLDVVDVVEGEFMQQFNNPVAPPYTYFISYVETDGSYGPHVLVGIQLLPNATGEWINFPEGNGTLTTITFKAISQSGEPEPPASCLLTLNGTMLVNDYLEEIPHNVTDGYYQIEPLTFSYEPVLPINGEVVLFHAPSNPMATTYSWNFGDGTEINTTEPTVGHAYNKPQNYNVTLMVSVNGLSSSTATKTVSISTGFYESAEVTVDVGSLHFNGEVVEFNVLITHLGKVVNATNIHATLYYNGILYADLSDLVELVDTGLYRIPYTIPGEAETGTYTLMVKAEYFNVEDACIKSFLISPTLSSAIAQITEIKDGIATVITDLSSIKVNLTSINAKLVSIEGSVALIDSKIGTLQTDLTNINATITNIIIGSKGEILAEIDSDFGSITTQLDNITANDSTTMIGLWIASVFSLIAAIAALFAVALLRRRIK